MNAYRIYLVLTFLIVFPFMEGCGTGKTGTGRYEIPVPTDDTLSREKVTKLRMTGYSIQVGAFANMENAVRLAAILTGKGLEAYYIRDRDGLFKVRFGDYLERKDALDKAEEFLLDGMIDTYYIVNPDRSSAALARVNGIDYLRNEIVSTAQRFLGLPYKWGGTSPETGFDCSGLAMVVYQLNGLMLPRTSIEQYAAGTPVKKNWAEGGDLVFFDISGERKSFHVGIYAGHGSFIHAPSEGKKIRLSRLSNPYFSERFVGARTYL